MSKKPGIPKDTEASWQTSGRLVNRLSESTGLESACNAALTYVLENINRPGGALLVKNSGGKTNDLIIRHDLSARWADQVDDPDSFLQKAWQRALEDGDISGIDNISNNADYDDLAALHPIFASTQLLGILMILGEQPSPQEKEELERLLPSLGQVIKERRSLETAQNRTRDLAALQTELTKMGFTNDSESIQAFMIRGACKILNGEVGTLILLDEANDEWLVRKALGDDSEWIYQMIPKSGKGLIRSCLNSGDAIRVNDVNTHPDFDPSSDALGGLQATSMLCAPLVAHGEILGAFQIINKNGDNFDAYDQDVLTMIAVQVANAIYGTRLVQQLVVANADLESSRWELLRSRNTLRSLFDHLPTALYIVDRHYKLVMINQSRLQLVDKPTQSLIDQPCYQALFERSEPCPECRVMETFEQGTNTQRNERRWIDSEEAHDWEISTYPICDDSQDIVQAILHEQNVTDKHRIEGILAQSEKLAAIGQLAAGVAHEINNPLTAIIANAQMLQRELPPDSDLQESVDLISRAGARATQVVRNLLDFARKEEYHLGLTEVNETLKRALDLVQHEILARGVQVDFQPKPNLPPILASQDHLQSVWLNLLLNAIDSLDKSPGKIGVEAGKVGDKIHVKFTDNGKGIPPERLTRIFEPFYTTKEAGRGTGLGLSVCHRIIKQHGGQIWVESQVGVGSQFTVVLSMS